MEERMFLAEINFLRAEAEARRRRFEGELERNFRPVNRFVPISIVPHEPKPANDSAPPPAQAAE
jgi:hypothetical protein